MTRLIDLFRMHLKEPDKRAEVEAAFIKEYSIHTPGEAYNLIKINKKI